MTRDEVAEALKRAIEEHLNSDGGWGVAIGAPPEGFGLSDHPDAHNFMVTITAPLME